MSRVDPDLTAPSAPMLGGGAEPDRPQRGGGAEPDRALRGGESPPDASEAKLDLLFLALSDPTRRAVLARLSAGPLTVGDLAAPFGMALPSFLEHLRRLEAGGLIETWKEGRSRKCRLRAGALSPIRSWMEVQRDLWEARLDSLEDYLTQLLEEKAR